MRGTGGSGGAALTAFALAAALLQAALPAAAEDKEALPPGVHEAALRHEGRLRGYQYFLPSAHALKESSPLLIVYSGGRGGIALMRRIVRDGIDKRAEKEGFIVVYPERVENIWNDGRGVPTYKAQAENVDDIGLTRRLIELFVRKHKGDPERVYVLGFSNGAFMAHRAACELSRELAAVAEAGGAIPTNVAVKCRPKKPMPLLMIHGDQDNFTPWDDEYVRLGPLEVGRRLTVPDTVLFWLRKDRCRRKPVSKLLPDADPEDGTRVKRYLYGHCRKGAEVAVYEVQGGGHTWPGGYAWQPEYVVGRISRDIDATDVIFDFFLRHPPPEKP